jgi:DNA helicase-2/ATP-dependent DNA helicase PcrA
MEEDVFPHIRSINSFEQVEEERRLFYVGMTRAKRILHITLAKRRFLWGSEKIMKASRFISELPKEHILGEHGANAPQGSSEEVSVGSAVFHKTFGKGIVEKVYETSYGRTYDVFFERDRQKRTLVARYSGLTT